MGYSERNNSHHIFLFERDLMDYVWLFYRDCYLYMIFVKLANLFMYVYVMNTYRIFGAY